MLCVAIPNKLPLGNEVHSFTLPNGLHRIPNIGYVSPSRGCAGTGTFISRPLISSISNRWVKSDNLFGKQTVKQYEYTEKIA